MESVQISPCGFICEREESWCFQISGWKYRHFETPTTKTDVLTFLENKRLFARTTYIRLLIYLKAIYGQKMKASIFQLLPLLTVALNFWCIRRTRKVLSTCKKNSVDRLNFKTKVVDNIPKWVLRTGSLVRPPDDNINEPNSDWIGKASECSIFVRLVLNSKLRFMNWTEGLFPVALHFIY